MILSPLPVQKFFDNNGQPLVGGLLFTYEAGTSTPIATYVDSTGNTQNSNPIVLNFRGEANIWLDQSAAYKFVLSPANDTDPPTNPIWTVDDIVPGAIVAFGNYSVDTGIANTYIAASAIPVPAYAAGLLVEVKIAHANTGPSTLNYASLGPKAIVLQNGAALAGGEIIAGGIYQFQYDGTQFQLLDPAVAYWETSSENNASITPADFQFSPAPIVDARRYGFKAGNSAAANATAIADAIAALPKIVGIAGGTIQLPSGSFDLNPVAIPEYVIVRGTGKRSTQVNYAGTAALFTLGGTSGALSYGCGVSDMDIRMSNASTTTTGVLCQGTEGAQVERLYIQGTTGAGGLINGVVIDGSNASTFQNDVRDVQCNHIGVGFTVTSSGMVQSTQTLFENCYSLGDDGISIGFLADDGQAINSVWIGGNLEHCGTGVKINPGAGDMTFVGLRFEANSTDIELGLTSNPCVFVGCKNVVTVVDNSGGGYEQHQFIGCATGTGSPIQNYPNKFVGTLNTTASLVTDVPLQATGASSQTAALLQLNRNPPAVLFEVDATGSISALNQNVLLITAGTGSPEGAVTAPTGSIYLNVSGGASTTLYVKQSGAGNTGWVGK